MKMKLMNMKGYYLVCVMPVNRKQPERKHD